jgi:hypothetical protein
MLVLASLSEYVVDTLLMGSFFSRLPSKLSLSKLLKCLSECAVSYLVSILKDESLLISDSSSS